MSNHRRLYQCIILGIIPNLDALQNYLGLHDLSLGQLHVSGQLTHGNTESSQPRNKLLIKLSWFTLAHIAEELIASLSMKNRWRTFFQRLLSFLQQELSWERRKRFWRCLSWWRRFPYAAGWFEGRTTLQRSFYLKLGIVWRPFSTWGDNLREIVKLFEFQTKQLSVALNRRTLLVPLVVN